MAGKRKSGNKDQNHLLDKLGVSTRFAGFWFVVPGSETLSMPKGWFEYEPERSTTKN
jgi:hypothetical protein